jgi:hypothetical protein
MNRRHSAEQISAELPLGAKHQKIFGAHLIALILLDILRPWRQLSILPYDPLISIASSPLDKVTQRYPYGARRAPRLIISMKTPSALKRE